LEPNVEAAVNTGQYKEKADPKSLFSIAET
jgi:hypothetical protein